MGFHPNSVKPVLFSLGNSVARFLPVKMRDLEMAKKQVRL